MAKPTQPPVRSTTATAPPGRAQRLPTAAQHAEAARAHAKLASQHAAQAAAMSRDAQRAMPKRRGR